MQNNKTPQKPPLPGSDLEKLQKTKTTIQNLIKAVTDLTVLTNRYKFVIADTATIMKRQLIDQGHDEMTADKAVDGYMKRVEFILKGGKPNG